MDESVREYVEKVAKKAAVTAAKELAVRRWLTAKEAAEYLGVTVNHLERLRYTRDPECPPYARWGRQIRYDINEIDRFLKAREQRAS